MTDRELAICFFVQAIKDLSVKLKEDMHNHDRDCDCSHDLLDKDIESVVIRSGFKSLRVLGVTNSEIAEAFSLLSMVDKLR